MSQPIKPKEGATPKERHAYAMDLAEQAMRCDDPEKALQLNAEAFGLEREIAEAIPANKENEPSRSILYRSAASLALCAGVPATARELDLEGLSGHPPSCVAQELFDVYQDADRALNKGE